MKLTTLKTQIATMRNALEAMEASLAKEEAKRASKKGGYPSLPATPECSDSETSSAPSAPKKPKRAPTSWNIFTQRVNTLLKANNVGGNATENNQFASSLKVKKAYVEWADDEILAEKATWVKPEKLEMPKAESNISAEVDKIMDDIMSDNGSVSGSEAGQAEKTEKTKKRGRPSKKATE
jgi:hypothetical protein